MRISDWSSDVCSSDLGQGRWHAHGGVRGRGAGSVEAPRLGLTAPVIFAGAHSGATGFTGRGRARVRSYTLLKPGGSRVGVTACMQQSPRRLDAQPAARARPPPAGTPPEPPPTRTRRPTSPPPPSPEARPGGKEGD